jgi:hypothetical protein
MVLSVWDSCTLALAASLITPPPPRASHALLPCKMAMKCHSAETPKSSCNMTFKKFYLFLYCPANPSEK